MLRSDLITRALEAPPDVDRLDDPDGGRVEISRSDGHLTATLFDPDGAVSTRVDRLEPAPARPSSHPADLPFVPGFPCMIIESERGRSAVWGHGEPDTARIAAVRESWAGTSGAGDFPRFEAFLEGMKGLRSRPADERRAGMAELFEELGLDRARMEELRDQVWSGATDEGESAALDQAFDDMLEQCHAQGWEERGASAPTLAIRRATLSRNGDQRFLARWTILGLSQLFLHDGFEVG